MSSDLENLLYSIFAGASVGIPIIMFLFIWLLIIVFAIVFGIGFTILFNFPLYKMAKNAGYNKPILAFIPIANTYLLAILSKNEFNIFNWIVTKNRKKAGIICALICASPLILSLFSFILVFIPFVGSFLAALLSPIYMLLSVVIYIISWRLYYDLFLTYGTGENAMLFSILSLFVPYFFVVVLYINMNKEPDYGFNNFYAETSYTE